MKLYIAALPLFDKHMAVEAYWLCDQSTENALGIKNDFRAMSEAFSAPGLELLEQLGTAPFAGDKRLVVTIKKMQLLTDFPLKLKLSPDSLICLLPGTLEDDDTVVEKCRKLKSKGFSLAMDSFPRAGLDSRLMACMDFLFLDKQHPEFSEQYRLVSQETPYTRVVLTNIPDMQTFKTFSGIPGGLFSGHFYNQPITENAGFISPIKINALQLLNNVNNQDFDLEDIVKIILRDPSLSISLLKFINSSAVGLRRKVNSIQAAVAILGQEKVRRWAMIAISVGLADDRPGEITKLSLVRAKFAENLAGLFDLGVFQSSLFMTGLFSLLDVILQKSMVEAIREVAVDDRVVQALVYREGDFYPVLDLMYTYERADWDEVSKILIRRGIAPESITDAFVEALVWYNQLLQSIDAEDEDAQESPEPAKAASN